MLALDTLDILLGICLSIISIACFRQYQLKRKGQVLPPGPPAAFFGFGDNGSELSKHERHTWETYVEWAKQYGPLFSYRLGGTPVIVLSTAKAAWDLLEKRGDIYSSRPRQVMAQELLSGDMRGIGMPYGDRWRRWRKIQHVGMSGRQAITYKPMQILESCLLVRDIIRNQDDYAAHIQRFATSIVFSISYGTRIQSLEDQIVKDNAKAIAPSARYMKPGEYLVNSYPSLLWLPRPLQWFRREPQRLWEWSDRLYVGLFMQVAEKMREGTARECQSSRVLTPGNEMGMTEQQRAWAVSAAFTAGVGTTKGSLLFFILAMLHYPEVAKKAQQELDSVVGQDRMPTFEDEPDLPYVGALLKEVTRWRPIAPIGIAHAVTQDDYYEGYFIPKGSTIFANIHEIARDPELFDDPDVFRPERYLNTSNPRLVDFTIPFGFGRRICPGMHVASQTLWIAMARMLWAFNILPVIGPDGTPVLPDSNAYAGQLTIMPVSFRCRFVPRRADVVSVVETDAADADIQLKAWD